MLKLLEKASILYDLLRECSRVIDRLVDLQPGDSVVADLHRRIQDALDGGAWEEVPDLPSAIHVITTGGSPEIAPVTSEWIPRIGDVCRCINADGTWLTIDAEYSVEAICVGNDLIKMVGTEGCWSAWRFRFVSRDYS